MDKPSESKFDNILLTIVERNGSVVEFLAYIASFLRRRTDFFCGPCRETWERVLINIFCREYDDLLTTEKVRELRQSLAFGREFDDIAIGDGPMVRAMKIENNEFEAFDRAGDGDTPPLFDYQLQLSQPIESADGETGEEDNGKLLPNVGNGCNLKKYSWTQTLRDVELKVPLPAPFNVQSRNVVVEFGRKSLKVGLKHQPPIIDGELCAEIVAKDCCWIIMEYKTVYIILEKVNKMNWWDRLVVTDTPISIREMIPKRAELADWEGDARICTAVAPRN